MYSGIQNLPYFTFNGLLSSFTIIGKLNNTCSFNYVI